MGITEIDQSLDLYPFRWMSNPDLQEMKIRSSIFIITGVCAGLPALVWSVSDIVHHRKNGHRISIFILLLLLTDFLELLSSPYILTKDLLNELVRSTEWTCKITRALWLSSRVCGFLLNQLVAFEGILTAKNPQCTTSVFSSPCFIIFYTLVLLCIIITSFLFYFVFSQGYIIFICTLAVSEITWIISCRPSCSDDINFHTSRKADRHIFVVFIFTLLVFYLYLLNASLYNSYLQISHNIFDIPGLLLSLRLISDPLLCVLVCRQNLCTNITKT